MCSVRARVIDADRRPREFPAESDGIADLGLAPLRRLVWVRPGPFDSQELPGVAPQIAPAVCQGAIRGDQAQRRRNARRRHAGQDEDRRGVLGFRRLREFVRKMGRRGRPEVMALPDSRKVLNSSPSPISVLPANCCRRAARNASRCSISKGFVARITCHCCKSVSLRVKDGFPEAGWMGFKT